MIKYTHICVKQYVQKYIGDTETVVGLYVFEKRLLKSHISGGTVRFIVALSAVISKSSFNIVNGWYCVVHFVEILFHSHLKQFSQPCVPLSVFSSIINMIHEYN